jgi:hypothetical protein
MVWERRDEPEEHGHVVVLHPIIDKGVQERELELVSAVVRKRASKPCL